ncbi:MAG: arylsulfatase A-like enzyme [Candidatus Krumholzibacteriia bacterium]
MLKRWIILMIISAAVVASGCGEQKPRPNIVLVVLDTVRSDYTQRNENARPVLSALARESTVFNNAWATAPWTVPSHASMFTGKLASGHHCTHQNPRLDAGQETVAEQLTASGYATAAFYSNPWLASRTTGLLRGFTEVQEAPVQGGIQGDPGTWRGDQGGRASVTHFRRWVKKQEAETPFFAFVNLLEAHLPYDPSPQVRQALLPQHGNQDVTGNWGMEYQSGKHSFDEVDWQRFRDLYWGDVATVDHLLSGITATLQEFGLAENTILIVCSDHGENLGDHELVDHQFSLHETLLSVPLIIRAPDYLEIGERNDPVMLSDLYATMREFAQIKGEVPVHSRSLLGERASPSRPLVAEYAIPQRHLLNSLEQINPGMNRAAVERSLRSVRVGDMRLTLGSDGQVQLHDLMSDEGQAVDLAASRVADVKALRALLQQELSVYQPGGRSEVELDEATREQLRSLGYVR